MELKKSQRADLENKKFIFWEIGMAMALLFTLLAFEWKVDTSEAEAFQTLPDDEVEEEIIPITRQLKPPPPPPPPAPKITDILNIVDDDEDLDDELEIEDVEADQDDDIEIQEVYEEAEEYGDEVFVVVENMPQFPGGTRALNRFIAKTVKYPPLAQEHGVTGRVIVGFVIGKDGSVSDVKVLRPVDPSLDKEAIRVIKAMPKWKPGKQRGKPVRVSYTVPINFQLN